MNDSPDYIAMKELLDDWSDTVAAVLRGKGKSKISASAPDLAIYLNGIEFRPPSSSQAIALKEKELGITLPRDYFSFLTITNGWPIVDFCQSALVGIEDIGLYSSLYPKATKFGAIHVAIQVGVSSGECTAMSKRRSFTRRRTWTGLSPCRTITNRSASC